MRTLFSLLFFVSFAGQSTCSDPSIKLQVLGSGGPELDDDRASSAYLIWHQNKAKLMVDAGPGASINYGRTDASMSDLEAILFTHLHVDHTADLPAFIKGSYFTDRTAPLKVFGPDGNRLMPATSEYLNSLFSRQGAYAYLHDYWEADVPGDYKIKATNASLKPDKVITYALSEQISVASIGVHHGPVAAVAWRVDIGSCSISFSGDMSNRFNSFTKLARGSDLLVMHNAIPERAGPIARNLHMPPSEIGKIAQNSQAAQVLLSHRMKRTLGREQQTLAHMRKTYAGKVVFANDLDLIALHE